ncbi:MAG: YlxR family protein [Deltaproteobacteria bacterium]|nr:YlxR family protein [Deltaproteobacteria bacterium]
MGCAHRKRKEDLLRIVIKDGILMIDADGRLPGRGAYLCHRTACVHALLKKWGRLSYALRVFLPRDAEKDFLRGLLQSREEE